MLIRSLFALIANVSLLLVPVATLWEVVVHYYLLPVVFSPCRKSWPCWAEHWWIDLVIYMDFLNTSLIRSFLDSDLCSRISISWSGRKEPSTLRIPLARLNQWGYGSHVLLQQKKSLMSLRFQKIKLWALMGNGQREEGRNNCSLHGDSWFHVMVQEAGRVKT